MELVGETMVMSVSNHYKVMQEMQDRAQDALDHEYERIENWREAYIELTKAKWKAEEECDRWKVLAFEQSARVYELEAELEQLKKGMGS